tara:strand:+ start:273 stop:383 length:111 start_codon:yes stop_codon:yes gene_type:complete
MLIEDRIVIENISDKVFIETGFNLDVPKINKKSIRI